MLEIYHHTLCPFSRKLRIVLKEKGIEFELFQEAYWQRRKEFLRMNPAGETPVIINEGVTICGNNALFEYLEETYNAGLFFGPPEHKANIRRVTEWFDVKFFNEVTRYILNEKIIKSISRTGSPNSQAIQVAKKNILYHLDYIAFLHINHTYLAGESISIADFAAAAQLSVLDFIGDIPWHHSRAAKEWYALIKSRPSFKPILLDKMPLLYPPSHYSNPDF